MKFFKSLLAVAAAVFLGSSVWAGTYNYTLYPGQSYTAPDKATSSTSTHTVSGGNKEIATCTTAQYPTFVGGVPGETTWNVSKNTSSSTYKITVTAAVATVTAELADTTKTVTTPTLNISTNWVVLADDPTIVKSVSVNSASTKATSKTVTITLNGKAGSTQVHVYVRKGTSGTTGQKEVQTINVTVNEPPMEFNYSGVNFTTVGAETNYVGGELVMTFKSSGSLKTDKDISNARVLVVGGGGGGGASSSGSKGSGGGGATVKNLTSQPIKGGSTITVTVGAGGDGAVGAESSSSRKEATAGGESAFGSITAGGGARGEYKGLTNGVNGVGYDRYDISGPWTYYGLGGSIASGNTAGTNSVANSGNGGQAGGCQNQQGDKSGGNGGSGVVIVRVPQQVTVESRASTAPMMTTTDQPADVQLESGSKFPKSVKWNSSVTSGNSSVATATMVAGSTETDRPKMTITPQGAGTTTLTVKNSDTSTSFCDYTWTVTVTVAKSVTVTVGAPATTIDTAVQLGGRFYYKLVGDGTATDYVALDPNGNPEIRPASGVKTGDLKVSGKKPTSNPVTVYLQTNGRTSSGGTYTNVVGKVYSVTVTGTPVAVPQAKTGLQFNNTEQTGVEEGTGYTLTGNKATDAGDYTAIATLDSGCYWADDYSVTNKSINWSIARAPATVTVVSTNKLVGAAEPVYRTKNEGFIATDPTVLTWTAFRTNASETVGTYDVIVVGETQRGNYQISYNKGTLEIRAGKMTVNGKGYDNITDAFQDLLQNKGSATFNDTGIDYDGMTFQRGATLTVAADNSWTVTNNGGTSLIATKIPGKMNLTVDGTLELSGDIFVAPMGEDDTIVTVTNFLLDASITVGKESNGATDAMAHLTFNTFTNEDPANRITLTTNGVIRSEEKLTIADVFTEPTKIKETQVDGWWEYTYLPLIPVDVPEAVDGLVYNGNEQTGVVENVGFTLTGNLATNADDYTAEAELANGYCWADDGSVTNKFIDWSIGKFAITVTPVATNKLVGAKDPELTYTTNVDPVEGDEFIGELSRDSGEDVDFYDITRGTLAIDDDNEGANYDLTFETAAGENAFEIKAGVINVNGKGYATVEEAFAALVLAAKSGTATATFNEEVEAQGYKFAQGAVLTIAEGGVWTVTGDVTVPMVEKEKTVTVSDGTLTLAGNIFVGDRADVTTEVLATNVVLAANVTVGAATEGFEPAGIATLAFDEIDVDEYKLTLTTNGVVQSAKALDIDAIFTEAPEFFQITETQIDGGFEYKLEALNVVEVPTAVDGLVYNGEEQTGVEEGEGYTLTGNTGKDADGYTATATLEEGYCWSDGSTDAKTIDWSIDYAQVKVTANDAEKFEGGEDPTFTATVEGEVAGEEGTITYTLEREEGEDLGNYTIFAQGDEIQGNYKVAYVNGTFTIYPKPTITIHIKQGDWIADVKFDGESVNKDLELSAETTEVELELEAYGLTVPVFKVVRGNVTNVTTKVKTYAIADGDTLEFFAEEADETDPTVTDDDIKTALIESIDDDNPDTREAAEKKVNDVAGTGAKQVLARELATYITDKHIQSSEIADCDYVAASVKLYTDDLIDEDTEVEIAELVKAEGNALTFTVDIDSDPVNVEAIKDMVEASSDLTAWNDHKLEVTATFEEGEEGDAGKVTITPKDPTDKAFMKVVIPKDPGVE